jgi:hypothetical protein
MNQPINARNATVAVDCPWCAEPLRASLDELADGFACPACRVEVLLVTEVPAIGRRMDRSVSPQLAA